MDREESGLVGRERARRYAQAVSAASGSKDRIGELEQALEDSEWCRDQAEAQLERMESGVGLKLYTILDDEPWPDSGTLIDLSTGCVWTMNDGHTGGWTKLDGAPGRYSVTMWPLPGGPFTPGDSSWEIDRTMRNAEETAERAKRILDRVEKMEGYWPDGDERKSTWNRPPLDEAVLRVLSGLQLQVSRWKTAASEAELRLAEYEVEVPASMRDAAKLDKRPVLFDGDVTQHGLVRKAEGQILAAADLPVEGDPSYARDGLTRAMATLALAADWVEPDPEPDLPF